MSQGEAKTKKNGKHELSAREAMALGMLIEQERNLISSLQEQIGAFHRGVEERLGLEAGSIGTTHELDAEELAVKRKQVP